MAEAQQVWAWLVNGEESFPHHEAICVSRTARYEYNDETHISPNPVDCATPKPSSDSPLCQRHLSVHDVASQLARQRLLFTAFNLPTLDQEQRECVAPEEGVHTTAGPGVQAQGVECVAPEEGVHTTAGPGVQAQGVECVAPED